MKKTLRFRVEYANAESEEARQRMKAADKNQLVAKKAHESATLLRLFMKHPGIVKEPDQHVRGTASRNTSRTEFLVLTNMGALPHRSVRFGKM